MPRYSAAFGSEAKTGQVSVRPYGLPQHHLGSPFCVVGRAPRLNHSDGQGIILPKVTGAALSSKNKQHHSIAAERRPERWFDWVLTRLFSYRDCT